MVGFAGCRPTVGDTRTQWWATEVVVQTCFERVRKLVFADWF